MYKFKGFDQMDEETLDFLFVLLDAIEFQFQKKSEKNSFKGERSRERAREKEETSNQIRKTLSHAF